MGWGTRAGVAVLVPGPSHWHAVFLCPYGPLMRLNLVPGAYCQDAVRTLNTLQTNANYLEMVKRKRGDPQTRLEAMKLYLARSGLQVRWEGPVTTSTPHFCLCILCLRQGPCLSVPGGGLGPTEHYPHHWNQGEGESLDPGVGRPQAGVGGLGSAQTRPFLYRAPRVPSLNVSSEAMA